MSPPNYPNAPDAPDADLSMIERLLLRFNKRVELNYMNNLEGRFLCEQIIKIYTERNDVVKADGSSMKKLLKEKWEEINGK